MLFHEGCGDCIELDGDDCSMTAGLPAPVMKGCSMPIHLCCTCGTSYPDTAEPRRVA